MSIETIGSSLEQTSDKLEEPPSYLYDSLVSPESQAAFDLRIHQERIWLGAEKITLEHEQQLPGANRLELDRRHAALEDAERFIDSRDYYRLSHAHGLLFERDDPDLNGLPEALAMAAVKSEQPFTPDLKFRELSDETQPPVVIESSDRPIEFPATAFVSADSFISWQAGRGHGSQKDGKSSRQVIQDYASRNTPLPPVKAEALILPDGQVILRSKNAHRAAAAKLNGQATIKVGLLEVRRARRQVALNRDVVKSADELASEAAEQAVESGAWEHFMLK